MSASAPPPSAGAHQRRLREAARSLSIAAMFGLVGWGAASLTLHNLDPDADNVTRVGLMIGLGLGALFVVVDQVQRGRVSEEQRRARDENDDWIVSRMFNWLFIFLILNVAAYGIRTVAGDRLGLGNAAGDRGDYSYGEVDVDALGLILAPGVSVDLLPSARALGRRRFEEFDVSPQGSVLVRDEQRLLDMITGQEVASYPWGIHSFAYFGDVLTVVTGDDGLGYVDGGGFSRTGSPPAEASRLAPSSDRSRLLFYRDRSDRGDEGVAIASLRAGQAPEALSGARGTISAIGADATQTYYAQGGALFRLTVPGRAQRLFTLPGEGNGIVGILVDGGGVYFSTRRAVYLLGEGMALPLVIGVGGSLRARGADIYVLDATLGRVFRISRTEGTQ